MSSAFAIMDFDASCNYYITVSIDCISNLSPGVNNFCIFPLFKIICKIDFPATCLCVYDGL